MDREEYWDNVARERERQEIERRDEQARLADSRALWAVRVLDAADRYWHPSPNGDGGLVIWVNHQVVGGGATEEAARLAAAEAVFPALDRNAPNWPGEKP